MAEDQPSSGGKKSTTPRRGPTTPNRSPTRRGPRREGAFPGIELRGPGDLFPGYEGYDEEVSLRELSDSARKKTLLGGFFSASRKGSSGSLDKSPKSSRERTREQRKLERERELKEQEARYKDLGPEDLDEYENPNKLSLLHPATIVAVKEANLEGEQIEKDPFQWMILMNCLRFLKIDFGMNFNAKSTVEPKLESAVFEPFLSPIPKMKVGKMIGSGAFGKVYSTKCASVSKNQLVVKKVSNKSQKQKRMNLNEMAVLSKYAHPNIVQLFGCYSSEGGELWFMFEFLEGGTLEEGVAEYEEKHISYAARDMLHALEFLHENKIVHRDLKSANIMLDVHVDFGLAVSVEDGPLITICGSPFWLSPEMVRMDTHSTPTDIWSFAISLVEMVTSRPTKKHQALSYMFQTGCLKPGDEPTIPAKTDKWSAEMKDFFNLCLIPKQEDRATAKQLLEHPFLKKACEKEEMEKVLSRIFIKTSLDSVGM